MDKQLNPAKPILLIDDEKAWLNSFGLILRAAGLNNLVLCADSRRAMSLLAEHGASVIVLDLTMPHLSGDELLPLIVGEYPQIPVIIITGLGLSVSAGIIEEHRGRLTFASSPENGTTAVISFPVAGEQ